jgi:polygalacturonase/lysophospholipase L1-like esterase
MKRTLLMAGLAVISLIYVFGATASAEPNSTIAAVKVLDVRQLGAKGDGKTLDTEIIQKALDECGSSGGGIVRLPAGIYLSKPITLRSNTTLQLDEGAKLKATDDPQDFIKPGRVVENAKSSGDFNAFINGKKLTDIAITGKGTIDGSGVRWWIPAEEARKIKPGFTSPRPRLILLENCMNVRIINVTLVNSPSFHLAPKNCYNVLIEGVTIRAIPLAPNTDAIDPSVCHNVRISKCLIDVGDDDVAIKSGNLDPTHSGAAVTDVLVTDCTFIHGHGMSIGSETNGGVSNLRVQRCIFKNLASGIRIKSARGKGGLVENISYSDIIMDKVKVPINLSMYYEDSVKEEAPQPMTDTTPIFRNIHIKNVKATSLYGIADIVDRITDFVYYYYAYHDVLEPRNAGSIIGLPESPVTNVVLENVHISAPTGMTIQNANDIQLKNVKIETIQGPSFILKNAEVKGIESPAKSDTNSQPKTAQDANNTAKKIRIVLVGDSTVTDKQGWGVGFKRFITDKAECINTAAGGRSSKSFINENRWAQALELKGDYYLIQFGHNDEPGKGDRSTEPNTTYREFMTRYVDEARAIGAKPILITSLVRRQWDKSGSGKINSSLIPYVEVVKQIAKEKNVPLIDLHASSKELCEQWGKEKCLEFSPVKDNNQPDNTHLNAKGSVIFARLVVEELGRVVPELKSCFASEPAPAAIAEAKTFDVRQFGAKGDGNTLDTAAIQKALDECGKIGNGIVRLTAGTYLSKPIFLKSNTSLQLDQGAILKATDDPNDFADPQKAGNVLAFVNGNDLTNITIEGKGTIDGSGKRWWGPIKEAKKNKQPEPYRRPRLVVLNGCVGVRIKDVTLINSPSFHLVPRDCEDVDIVRVTIRAPEDSPNTDAIDPSSSRYVRISDCILDTGDDNIAIKSGHPDSAHPNAASEFITVSNCTFLHGHGMSIGSETIGGVRNLTVKNCTFENTESGIRIKSSREKGGLIENLTYSDITMKNVKAPINISTYYPKIPKEDTAQPVTSTTPIYKNIRITNVTATSPKNAGYIVGLPESLVENVVLENVKISAPVGLTIRNAKGIKLINVKVETEQGKEPFILENAQVDGLEQTTKQ